MADIHILQAIEALKSCLKNLQDYADEKQIALDQSQTIPLYRFSKVNNERKLLLEENKKLKEQLAKLQSE